MAEKDDHQNLGGELGPPQNRFLLVLFSGPPDIVPWLGIGPAQLTLSNCIVDNIVNDILIWFTYCVSAGLWKGNKIVSEPSMIYNIFT